MHKVRNAARCINNTWQLLSRFLSWTEESRNIKRDKERGKKIVGYRNKRTPFCRLHELVLLFGNHSFPSSSSLFLMLVVALGFVMVDDMLYLYSVNRRLAPARVENSQWVWWAVATTPQISWERYEFTAAIKNHQQKWKKTHTLSTILFALFSPQNTYTPRKKTFTRNAEEYAIDRVRKRKKWSVCF